MSHKIGERASADADAVVEAPRWRPGQFGSFSGLFVYFWRPMK